MSNGRNALNRRRKPIFNGRGVRPPFRSPLVFEKHHDCRQRRRARHGSEGQHRHVTGASVTFPDLNSPPFGGENFQTNLIMPEPTTFLSRRFPPCSIIRPTETAGAAMGAVNALTNDGLFIGQSTQFTQLLQDLAADADAAHR